MLAGGGTAGHISPLLAIAGALRAASPDASLLAVGTDSGMETRLVPAAGLELRTIDRVPLPRKPSLAAVKFPSRFLGAIGQAGRVLEEARADVLVGVGGYVCTPMYLAARRKGIPVVVHEANARAGMANRVGARGAATVAVAFKAARLPGARLVGMPMRPQISGLRRTASTAAAARTRLGLDPAMATVVVTGGSSGAESVNRAVAEAAPQLADAGVQLLHITGREKVVRDAAGQPLAASGYRQVEYVDGMEDVYAAADLLVARAGAATVCEVSAVGVPTIFVPLPHGNGEQSLNASELVECGGALIVDNARFTPGWVRENVLSLVRDDVRLAEMSDRSRELGIRDADEQMADIVLAAIRRDVPAGR